jgi:ABC-type branched-subunit amino acid transport system permease subunit
LAGVLSDPLDTLIIHGAFCSFALVAISQLRSRRVGRLAVAACMDENALRALGYSPTRLRLQAFVLAAVLAGMAGSLQTHYIGAVEPRMASIPQTVLFLCGTVLSGRKSVWGCFLGSFFLIVVPEMLQKGLTIGGSPVWYAFPLVQVSYGALISIAAFFLFPRGAMIAKRSFGNQ